MPDPAAVRTEDDSLKLNWESRHQRKKDRLNAWVAWAVQGSAYPGTTLPEYSSLFSLSPAGSAQGSSQSWYVSDLSEIQDIPTLPLQNELETVEICLDPEHLDLDLSLLDEKEKAFFENFVGAFDLGSEFTDEDLKIDDVF